MIVEGIVTTRNLDGGVNIAPMGPLIAADWSSLVLRPFSSSTTCANLRRDGHGIFHVTDDCELLARSAIDRFDALPPLTPIEDFPVPRLADTCRWYAFKVTAIDAAEQRVRFDCQVVRGGVVREFLGFNRAKHAVLEAAILATRVHLLPPSQLAEDMNRLRVIVEKTAGPQETAAFRLLDDFIRESRP